VSLSWDITKVKDYKDLYIREEREQDECELHPMTERLIFLTMEVDLMEITEKNVDEWLIRLEMMKKAGWAPRNEITRTDIERHVGLRTNVATKTRSQFRAKLIKHIEREAEDATRKARQEKP
jgi:type I site-specific restriction endonuclease